MLFNIFLALTTTVAAHPAHLFSKRQSYTGIATFNNYAAQTSTSCGPKAGMQSKALSFLLRVSRFGNFLDIKCSPVQGKMVRMELPHPMCLKTFLVVHVLVASKRHNVVGKARSVITHARPVHIPIVGLATK